MDAKLQQIVDILVNLNLLRIKAEPFVNLNFCVMQIKVPQIDRLIVTIIRCSKSSGFVYTLEDLVFDEDVIGE